MTRWKTTEHHGRIYAEDPECVAIDIDLDPMPILRELVRGGHVTRDVLATMFEDEDTPLERGYEMADALRAWAKA